GPASTISQGLRSPLSTSDDLPRTLTFEPGDTFFHGFGSFRTQRTPSKSLATSRLMKPNGPPNGSGRALSTVPAISMTLPLYLALAAAESFLKSARHSAGVTTRSGLPRPAGPGPFLGPPGGSCPAGGGGAGG